MGRSTTVEVVACPSLADIPPAAIDALEDANKKNPEVGTWVVDLSQHYDAIDRCNRK